MNRYVYYVAVTVVSAVLEINGVQRKYQSKIGVYVEIGSSHASLDNQLSIFAERVCLISREVVPKAFFGDHEEV